MVEGIFLAYEWLIRLAAFAGVIAAMALWEHWAPKRRLAVGRSSRWPGNLGVLAIDVVLVRILFPTAAVGAALVCEARAGDCSTPSPFPSPWRCSYR